MKKLSHIARRLWQRWQEARRQRRFHRALRHLHGPAKPEIGPKDVVLIALVRDGSYYLDQFFAHYRAMGVKHFVFIDNGSSDDTIDRIKAEPGTIIDQCTLPLAGFEDLIRAYPAQTYGQDRWCLYVDMDEILDFEGCARHGLPGLISYLEAQGHTAFVAQMLEMFPKTPLAEAAGMPFDEVLQTFLYFDLTHITRFDYHSEEIPFSALLTDNRVSTEDIRYFFGGIRGKVFGEACCLTKHPLVFNGEGVSPGLHPHLSSGVICSDVTGVIKHYKFANNTLRRDVASQSSGDLDHGEDAKRAQVMAAQPDVSLFSLDARRWNRVELLYRAGFLVESKAYTAHLERLPT